MQKKKMDSKVLVKNYLTQTERILVNNAKIESLVILKGKKKSQANIPNLTIKQESAVLITLYKNFV